MAPPADPKPCYRPRPALGDAVEEAAVDGSGIDHRPKCRGGDIIAAIGALINAPALLTTEPPALHLHAAQEVGDRNPELVITHPSWWSGTLRSR